MPFYDLKCSFCGHEIIDRMEPISTTSDQRGPCPKCSACALERAWLTKPANVIGDEIDIYIRHGLCHSDGTPRRYRSKKEIAQEAKRRGMTNRVEHKGRQGGDKSPHTTRWI